MKCDMELIRKMVLHMEDHPSGWAPQDMTVEGYTDDQISYHTYLLVDAGLADGSDVTNTESSGPEYLLNHLTSSGHDFADSARDQYIWDKVTAGVREKGLKSVTVSMFKKLLDKQIRKHLDTE